MVDEKSKRKVEKTAVHKVEELILRIDYADPKFKVDDTGISWDGNIDLYHGNIDIKSNFDYSIKSQIKGRSTNVKRMQAKRKYQIDKTDLENYLKESGTMFFVVLFKSFDEYKIYYADLLPYDLRKYLQEKPNNKNEISIRIKEVNNERELERILRNFSVNQREQKKISNTVFNQDNLSMADGAKLRFYDWHDSNFDILNLVGKEKYVYGYDLNDNIISISYVTLMKLSKTIKVEIKSKTGEFYYDDLIFENTTTEEKVYFGKAFCFDQKNNVFNINIKGTLKERLKQIYFIEDIIKNKGFYINDFFFKLEVDISDVEKCIREKDNYLNIESFLNNHNVKTDINLDKWSDSDYKTLLIIIDGIKNKTPINFRNWEISRIGSIKINDLIISIFAERTIDGKYILYSLWNDLKLKEYQFKYDDGSVVVETNNLYSILNAQAYCSHDIDINTMKEVFKEYKLKKDEETLINLQALEVIKAYDINGNDELLDYALFLLNKIKNYKKFTDTIYINKMQIKKRKNKLSDEDILKLINIRDRYDDIFYKISVNLLIDNIAEAKILFNKLDDFAKEKYNEFPISKYLN